MGVVARQHGQRVIFPSSDINSRPFLSLPAFGGEPAAWPKLLVELHTLTVMRRSAFKTSDAAFSLQMTPGFSIMISDFCCPSNIFYRTKAMAQLMVKTASTWTR